MAATMFNRASSPIVVFIILFAASRSTFAFATVGSCSELLRTYGIRVSTNELKLLSQRENEILIINKMLGRYAFREMTVDIDRDRFPIQSGFTRTELSIGSLDMSMRDFRVAFAHEAGHAIVDQHYPIKIRKMFASRRTHYDSYAEAMREYWLHLVPTEYGYAKGDSSAIEWSEVNTILYEELLGDSLAAYLTDDPEAMPALLKKVVFGDGLEQEQWNQLIKSNPIIITGRGFNPIANIDEFYQDFDRVHYNWHSYLRLTPSRNQIWMDVLKDLKSAQLADFIQAFICAMDRHLKRTKIGESETHGEFNQTFVTILMEEMYRVL